MMITATDLAWAAGFFDGEGCIKISRPGKKRRDYRLSLDIAQVDRSTLETFQTILDEGGSIGMKGNGCLSLKYQAGAGTKVLKKLLPYLRLKRPEALVALEFRRRVDPQNHQPLSPGECEIREAMYWQLRSLKKRVA